MTLVSVIIPARNAAQTLPATIAGLQEQDHDGAWETILVNDGSDDATVQTAGGAAIPIRVIWAGGLGPAGARNAGAAAARGELLAFLDADCRPTPEWLRAGVAALEQADLVQGATYPDPSERIGPFDRTLWVTQAHGLFESANLFVRRELFDRIGGFESWLGPADGKELGEDVWFGWQARRIGAHTVFCERAVAHHAVFPRTAAGYVTERARLRFFPPMARRIPELRDVLFYRRWFLNRRSATFDLALMGLAAALRSGRRSPLLALGPYLGELSDRVLAAGPRRTLQVMLADIAADAVGCAALCLGTIRSGTPLL